MAARWRDLDIRTFKRAPLAESHQVVAPFFDGLWKNVTSTELIEHWGVLNYGAVWLMESFGAAIVIFKRFVEVDWESEMKPIWLSALEEISSFVDFCWLE